MKSVEAAGSAAKIGTFDTNKELVAAIKDGKVGFAIDQQPYLQGYLAVDALWLYKTNGNTIGGGSHVATGPVLHRQQQRRCGVESSPPTERGDLR